VNALARLHTCLSAIFGPRFVEIGAPIDVAREDNRWSEPEPDIIVTRQDALKYPTDNPPAAEILLVVEVADSTLGFDLKTKARLYARAEIVEYWVVDVTGRRIIVHREPIGGAYAAIAAFSENESIAPLAAPTRELAISEVFRDCPKLQ
jgi:Uma2 family endonuclease